MTHDITPFRVLRDPSSGGYTNQPGVQVSGPRWGYPECTLPTYRNTLFPLLRRRGYIPGENFLVACYDHRFNPDDRTPFFPPKCASAPPRSWEEVTVEAVENLFARNNRSKILLVAHSNGFIYANHLVSSMPQMWVREHIAGLVSVAGNLVGGVDILKDMVAAYDEARGTTQWSSAHDAEVIRSFPVTFGALPSPEAYGDWILVEEEETGKVYTAGDVGQFLVDHNVTDFPQQYMTLSLKYMGPAQMGCVAVRALVADADNSTVGSLFVNPTGHFRVRSRVRGDGVRPHVNTAAFMKVREDRKLPGARCQCPAEVEDMRQLLGRSLNVTTLLTDAKALDYLVDDVILTWSDEMGTCTR